MAAIYVAKDMIGKEKSFGLLQAMVCVANVTASLAKKIWKQLEGYTNKENWL